MLSTTLRVWGPENLRIGGTVQAEDRPNGVEGDFLIGSPAG